MPAVNLNKIFPRLPITWKLAIAFVAIAGIPLLVVAVFGTWSALHELRASARAELLHDLELAREGTVRSLRELEQHLDYLAVTGLADAAASGGGSRALASASQYLESDPSALVRVKVIDADGSLVAAVEAPWSRLESGGTGRPQPLYHWVAGTLMEGETAYLPVELERSNGGLEVLSAVAAVRAIHRDGERVGAIVGEADAAVLFSALEIASPRLGGETALVDPQGLFLFHSRFKRNWARLLDTDAVNLATEFPVAIREAILHGEALVEAPGAVQIATASLSLGVPGQEGFVLYRAVPFMRLYRRVGEFLVSLVALGVLLVGTVAGLSLVAAKQITRPILRIRAAAHVLAQGGRPLPLEVESNDELEDLARDFNAMADKLLQQRASLESVVEERTVALSQTQAHLTQILTSSADAIVGLEPDGRVVFWNEGATSLFGFSTKETFGKPVADVLGPESGQSAAESRYLERSLVSFGAVINYRTRRRAKDGALIPVTLTKTALRDPRGGLVGYSLILRDDRAREMLEEQMRRSERLSAISIMAAGLAHELNNPLSVIGNRIELMQREAAARSGDAQLLKDLDVLRKQVGRIGFITGDLLRFAREDGEGVGEVDVESVVERVLRLVHRLFVAADVELTARSEADLPNVLANENVVETIVVNLLLNAKQATPPGGRVEILSRTDHESGVVVEVRDTGPGVPDELKLRIFEPFFTTKADRGGTGLGLAVCRALVDRLGGTLEVGRWEGGGASFKLRLPRYAEMGSRT